MLLVPVAGCNDGESGSQGAPPPTGPGLTAVDFRFEPSEVPVSGGQVTIRVSNSGGVLHNLSIPDIGADIDYKPRMSDNLIFVVPQSGRVDFFCKYHRDRGMAGAFIVQ